MDRAPLALLVLALVVALAWPISSAIGTAAAAEAPLCREMTPARILEHPALADEWAQAARSASPEAMARMRALLAEIRAAHGCTRPPEASLPPPRGAVLPPGHPPVPDPQQLPPGHPPISPPGHAPVSPPVHPPISPPPMPLFEAPATLTA